MVRRTTPLPAAKPVPSSEKEILTYFHCVLCFNEKPANVSPQEYQQIEAGFTPLGLQVWCRRHDCNIIHISFEGQKHLANTQRAKNNGK